MQNAPRMGRFMAGFGTACVLWGAFAYAHVQGWIDLGSEEPVEVAAKPPEVEVEEEEAPSKMRRRRRGRGRRGRMYSGNATSGDDLGENDPRELNAGAEGGEQQLTGAQIDSAVDQSFGRIRRCLVLVPEDAPARGRVTFGLRIAGSGRVTRVNLQGPAAVTRSEAGDCLREAARAIRFPSFDGPEMIVHYPITLE